MKSTNGVRAEPVVSESPFNELLHTNHVPTDAGIAQIRGHLAPHEAELARLDALIRDLSAKRERTKHYIDAHKALISHPRRLPPELLQKIFVECLPTAHNAVMSVAAAPLLLGHICSRWRAIAFATPKMWDSLHISVENYINHPKNKSAAIVDWLTRSAPFPLSLSISCRDPLGHAHSYCTTALRVLSKFSARWTSLQYINLPIQSFLQLEETVDAPLLRDVHVACRSSGAGHHHILGSKFFSGTKVSVTSLDPASLVLKRLQDPSYRWEHLTDLTLDRLGPEQDWDDYNTYKYLDYETVYRLLECCTNLRSLMVPIELGENLTQTLEVPALESLTLTVAGSECEGLEELVDHLVMPKLTKFHLINLEFLDYISPATVESLELLAENSPLISDLRLHLPHDDTVDTLHTVLANFSPHLQKLSLGLAGEAYPYVSKYLKADELFQNLAPDGVVIPGLDLTELSLDLEYVPDALWTEFLWKHINHHTKLRKFHLKLWSPHCRDVPPPVAPDVDPFLTRGLDVSVKNCIRPPFDGSPWQGIEDR
ncbi:hypothetical protein R3P38DRAFT_2666316 [Favolaschia claudopus]|uniref:F-box domain-containing protein n=1 Tax=Favolaschia claudopus TaxID=2862362 RepID=A0AAV9ZBM8_9AGAR